MEGEDGVNDSGEAGGGGVADGEVADGADERVGNGQEVAGTTESDEKGAGDEKSAGMFGRRGSLGGILPAAGSPLDVDKIMDTIQSELLGLTTAAQDGLKTTQEALQERFKRTEEALQERIKAAEESFRETQATLEARVKESQQTFLEAQQRLQDSPLFKEAEKSLQETQARLSEASKEAQEVLSQAQKQLLDWRERSLKAFLDPAPLNVPLSRRAQTLAIWIWTFLFLFPGSFLHFTVALLGLFNSYTAPFVLPYLLWMVIIDGLAPYLGDASGWLRKSRLWKEMAAFFPAELVKTVDLDPEKTYILGVHPHGVISIGAFLCFATEGTGFSEKFPNIKSHLCTLDNNFKVPFGREILLGCGMVAASRRAFRTLCDKSNPKMKGNAMALVVGGAAESMDTHPGDYKLLLGRRKGFIRMALETGASLVPVISFGENNLYSVMENPPGSKVRKFQEVTKKVTGVAPIIFYGRGAFNYAFGLLPFRRPVVTVVGKPIDVPKYTGEDVYWDEEGKQLTELYHQKYVRAVEELFHENVHLYDKTYTSFKVVQ